MIEVTYCLFKDLSEEIKGKLSEISLREGSWMKDLVLDKYNKRRSNSVHVFVARDGEEILGWSTAHHTLIGFEPNSDKKSRCFEHNICVSPQHRGKGVGTKLLTTARKILRRHKRASVSFPFDEAGIKVYRKAGIRVFKEDKDIEYNPFWE